MEKKYKSKRFVDRLRWVIVDDDGKVVNNNPSEDELKGLEKEPRKAYDTMLGKRRKYTDEQLKNELRQFEKEHGRPPTTEDFANNHGYPSVNTYINRFGSWLNGLIGAGLSVDLMSKRGNRYRGRQSEIAILNHLENKPVDLSGENSNSYCDAVDPSDGLYDVKSSKLRVGGYYVFCTMNKDKDDNKEAIQWYYLVARNDDGSVAYLWKVPGEIVEKDDFRVSINSWSRIKFTVENMKQYDITDKLRDVLKKHGY